MVLEEVLGCFLLLNPLKPKSKNTVISKSALKIRNGTNIYSKISLQAQ